MSEQSVTLVGDTILTLSPQDIQIILAGLGELQYKTSRPLIDKLFLQLSTKNGPTDSTKPKEV